MVSAKVIVYRFLIWCSGSDEQILELVPNSERKRHAQYGILVLIPAILALFTMPLAISTVTDHILLIIIVTIVWSGIIFHFDRFVVSSFNKIIEKNDYWKGLLIRILLASFVGLIIGHPFVLEFFSDKIDFIINEKMNEDAQKFETRKDTMRMNNKSLNDSLNQIVNKRQIELKKLERFRIFEENGGEFKDSTWGSTTKKSSFGPQSKSLRDVWQRDTNEFVKLVNAIDSEKTKNDLRLVVNLNRIDSMKSVFINNYPRDYLAKIEVFDELKKKPGSKAGVIEFILIALFILIDIAAVGLKSITKPGVYDYILSNQRRDMITIVSYGGYLGTQLNSFLSILLNSKLRVFTVMIARTTEYLIRFLNFDIDSSKLEEFELRSQKIRNSIFLNLSDEEGREALKRKYVSAIIFILHTTIAYYITRMITDTAIAAAALAAALYIISKFEYRNPSVQNSGTH